MMRQSTGETDFIACLRQAPEAADHCHYGFVTQAPQVRRSESPNWPLPR